MIEKLELSETNPAPFVQPFLVLHIEDGEAWLVDVDGKVNLYLDRKGLVGLKKKFYNEGGYGIGDGLGKHATKKMKDLIKGLRTHGYLVGRVGVHRGSGSPTHILRNGAFFKRMTQLEEKIPKVFHG
jgi:hypothetical protein